MLFSRYAIYQKYYINITFDDALFTFLKTIIDFIIKISGVIQISSIDLRFVSKQDTICFAYGSLSFWEWITKNGIL